METIEIARDGKLAPHNGYYDRGLGSSGEGRKEGRVGLVNAQRTVLTDSFLHHRLQMSNLIRHQ